MSFHTRNLSKDRTTYDVNQITTSVDKGTEEQYEDDFEEDEVEEKDDLNSTQSSLDHLGCSIQALSLTSSDYSEREEEEFNQSHDFVPSTSNHVDDKRVDIPDKLPGIHGLLSSLASLSMERLRRIHDHCKFRDQKHEGLLSGQQIIQSFAQIIPSANYHSSPWCALIRQLCPTGRVIDYNRLFRLLARTKFGTTAVDDNKKTIADVFMGRNHEMSVLPPLPPLIQKTVLNEQAMRERGRAQIMRDVENLLRKVPSIDLTRLKMATTKQQIKMDELRLILDLHGIEPHFRPFFHRLCMSFRTHNGHFHYSAFLGCLDNVKMPERSSAPQKNKKLAPWELPPLPALVHHSAPPPPPPDRGQLDVDDGTPRHISA